MSVQRWMRALSFTKLLTMQRPADWTDALVVASPEDLVVHPQLAWAFTARWWWKIRLGKLRRLRRCGRACGWRWQIRLRELWWLARSAAPAAGIEATHQPGRLSVIGIITPTATWPSRVIWHGDLLPVWCRNSPHPRPLSQCWERGEFLTQKRSSQIPSLCHLEPVERSETFGAQDSAPNWPYRFLDCARNDMIYVLDSLPSPSIGRGVRG
jgi:hypothetical protein